MIFAAILLVCFKLGGVCSGKQYFDRGIERYSAQVGWFAPFHSGGGYCSEARSFALALDMVGFKNMTIVQHGDSWNSEFVALESEKERRVLQSFDVINFPTGMPRISICHSEPGAWYTPNPKYHTARCPADMPSGTLEYYRIGRTMFETDRLPSGWLSRLQYMDEIWVPTEDARSIFIRSGLAASSLRVVPEAVDTDNFTPMPRLSSGDFEEKHIRLARLASIPSSTTVLLFVGKFEHRKGIDILLDAYFNEFSSDDDIVLLLVTSAYHSSSDYEAEVLSIKQQLGISCDSKALPPYIILSGLRQDDMPMLYSFAHALVIPSHGEGWGRPHMEAMSCATPVVFTNWSGPVAFLNSATGFPVEIEESLVPARGWTGHYWAQPKVNSLRQILRQIFTNPAQAKAKGAVAREHVVAYYSLQVIGAQVLAEIHRVEGILQARVGAKARINFAGGDL